MIKPRHRFPRPSKYQSLNTIYIHQQRLLDNLHYLQSLKPNDTIIPVLKSNAYGHGISNMCRILNTIPNKKLPILAVDSYPEYQIIRDKTTKSILVMGEMLPCNYKLMHTKRTHIAVSTVPTLKALIKTGKPYQIHLFLNTGMNREGLQIKELKEAIKLIQKTNIQITGVMSHLATADDNDSSFIQAQINHYKAMLHKIKEAGYQPRYLHIGNSGGIAKVQDPLFNTRRTGLSLYGYNHLNKKDDAFWTLQALQPALSITSHITSIQQLEQDDGVSYGLNRITDKPTTTITIPFGYNEGLPRHTNAFHIKLLQNTNRENNPVYLPVVGNICMNLCIAHAGKQTVRLHQKVEILSIKPSDKNSLHTLANEHMIPYSVLVGLNPYLKRVIV